TIDGNKVTFVFEMNAAISKTGNYSFAIPAGLIKATDGEEFAGQTFTFNVKEAVVEPEEPDTTEKQYRVKCDNGYLNIYSTYAYPAGPIGGVNIAEYAEDNNQIFTVEDAGNGNVYLKSASGLYIYCQPWNVDGNANDKSALTFEETENGKFYIKCSNGYFKVQNVSGVPVAKIDEVDVEQPALSGYFPYCDAAIDAAALWSLEEVDAVEPEVPETPTGLNETVVFDFVNGGWNIPTMEQNNYSSIKTAGEYTDGTKTIKIDPTANGGSYIYDSKGFLNISKPGTKIILPVFDFAVEKIEVVGHTSATSYANVDMNVYVGSTAVSTACIGSTETYTYEIAADNQAAGNVYELVIGSNGGNYSSVMYITYIKVYPAENKLEAPVIDLASGVYVGAQTVNVHSATADIEGVTNVTYYYTTNGNEPTVEDEETDGEITIENSCTLKVIVELTYGDKTYVSASTSAEYIISEAVTYHRAVAVESGSYFLAANGHVAAPLANGVLPGVETTIDGNDLTEAAYYAITLEEAAEAGTYYIKDVNGNYIYTSSMYGTSGPKLSSNGAYTPKSSWTITIAEDENSTATIVSEGLTLVYDTAAGAFKVTESVSDGMVLPTFYGTKATGVENVVTNGEAIESIYDLQGRKIEKVTEGGIYIVNGKKVLVK
ncbi:MAG: chitobiase/beta-hexosaminidase C-terminal domain-containing protein, partial [Bacteroidaceae bacterium]|nr:chitobiase/beta-hexosaminidase C-terminal domain-containing protein [Bacteroidaceae bacterium]